MQKRLMTKFSMLSLKIPVKTVRGHRAQHDKGSVKQSIENSMLNGEELDVSP